jgi:hypothetical protein
MSRIFKGSRYQLQLLITSCSYTSVESLRIKFFTTDPNSYVETTENIALNGNIAAVTINSNLFDGLDEGLLTYEISGLMDGIYFTNERQSTYFLKNASPLRMAEQKQTKQIFVDLNGIYYVEPDEGYSALERVVVEVNVPKEANITTLQTTFEDLNGEGKWWIYANDLNADGLSYVEVDASNYGEHRYQEGLENGRNESGNHCNLGNLEVIFEDRGDGNCWWNPADDGYDGYSYVTVNASNYGEQRYQEGLENGRNEGSNLNDRWITPNNEDIIDDNFLIIFPEEGYDGMSRVVMTRNEISAPNYLYGLNAAVGEIYKDRGYAMIAQIDGIMANDSRESLDGIFDHEDMYDFVTGNGKDWVKYGIIVPYSLSYDNLTNISYMYSGNLTIPIISCEGISCQNVVNCEGAFNGWTKLAAMDSLYELGNSFRTEQTLDLSMTQLNNNPNTIILIKSLHNFNSSPSIYGVQTSYIKGLSNFREQIENMGWQCID